MEVVKVAENVTALVTPVPVPGIGFLPVNSFVIKTAGGAIVVDSCITQPAGDFLAGVAGVVDPADIAWIWLTHPDRDHTGGLLEMLDAAPNARLMTSFTSFGHLSVGPEPVQPESLDAGPALTVKGPSGTRTITDIKALGLDYYKGVTFGDTAPGNFFDPGHYTVTGPGGKGVGPFMASIDVPSVPFVWTNIPSILTPLDRSKDLTIKWTGGIPNTQVTAVGGSAPSAFLCASLEFGVTQRRLYTLVRHEPDMKTETKRRREP